MGKSSDAVVGSELAGYLIEALIGRGGMGAVYRAEELALGRKVALKVIAPELAEDDRFRERFLRESRIAASLDHPHIVPIFKAGDEDGALFLAMRYVEGTDLAKLLREGRARLSPRGRPRSSRSPRRSTPRTRRGSSTATSSRRTCSSPSRPARSTPTWPTSG